MRSVGTAVVLLMVFLASTTLPHSAYGQSQVSSIVDPADDLIYTYTGERAGEYSDFVDIETAESWLSTELECTITAKAGPPAGLNQTVWYSFMFDENNNSSDNSVAYPLEGIDTLYTVIYTPSGWSIERAKYQAAESWWVVEHTQARFALSSSLPGGFSVTMRIPLTEVPQLTMILPWKVKTETFTYPQTFPPLGDLAPNERRAYLPPLLFKIVFDDVSTFYQGELVYQQGETFEISVLHENGSIELSVTDPNQTLGMTRLTWKQTTTQLEGVLWTVLKVSIPPDALTGKYIFSLLYRIAIFLGPKIQEDIQVEIEFKVPAPKEWTKEEEEEYRHGKESPYRDTLLGDGEDDRIKDELDQKLKEFKREVDDPANHTKVANQIRKWISSKADWENTDRYESVKDFLKAIDGAPAGKKVPAQCTDFAELLVAFLRKAGIPARFVEARFSQGTGWTFHWWVEFWCGQEWSAIDATSDDFDLTNPQDGAGGNSHDAMPLPNGDNKPDMDVEQDAMSPKEYWKKFKDNGATIRKFDGTRDEQGNPVWKDGEFEKKYKGEGGSPGGGYSLRETHSVVVIPSVDKIEYLIGEDVTINVSLVNADPIEKVIEYNLLVQRSIQTVAEAFSVLNITDIAKIPAGASRNTLYTMSKEEYLMNGEYVASVTTNETISNSTSFRIKGGVTVSVSAPSVADVDLTFEVIFSITNILPRPVNNVNLSLSLPYFSSVSDFSLNIATLLPGETMQDSFTMSISEPAPWTVCVSTKSIDSGFVFDTTSVKVLSPPLLEVRIDGMRDWAALRKQFFLTSEITNAGDYPLNNIEVTLELFGGLSAEQPLTRNIADLPPRETTFLNWTITAGDNTGIFPYTISAHESAWRITDTNYALIEVTGDFMEDPNRDHRINILDIALVATAFGSVPPYVPWNPVADMDGNGRINIIDITSVAIKFGKTY